MNMSMYIAMYQNEVWREHNKNIKNGYIWMVRL